MNIIEQLISESEDGQKELARQTLIVSVTEQIWAAMEANGVSKSELATRLGVTRPYVTQLLNGHRNMTLATLADIAAALGVTTAFVLSPTRQGVPIGIPSSRSAAGSSTDQVSYSPLSHGSKKAM